MEWEFNLPVKLVFGNGKRKDIENISMKSVVKTVCLFAEKALKKTVLQMNL